MDSAYDFGYVTGQLDVANATFGLMGVKHKTAVAFFRLAAGIQSHPVRAIDRLAFVVYCYYEVAEQLKVRFIDVAVKYTLVSGSETSVIMAQSIHWFTSAEIRRQAEIKLGEMTGKSRGAVRMSDWPWKQEITLPNHFQPAIIDPIPPHEKR